MAYTYNTNLIYPELSYSLVGVLFDVYNSLGYGYNEMVYHKAIAVMLHEKNICFREQVQFNVFINEMEIIKGFADFVVENKIILELKRGNRFRKQNIDQIYNYLRMSGLKLGMIANFTSVGVIFKRIINSSAQ
jgi:GxxExxY protein